MDTLVVLKMVPDIVEELTLAADGRGLDRNQARMILNESDDHALEEALLLKERHGGKVTVLALDAPELDEALFAALAKGADRAVKVTGAAEGLGTRQAAAVLGQALISDPIDKVVTYFVAFLVLAALTDRTKARFPRTASRRKRSSFRDSSAASIVRFFRARRMKCPMRSICFWSRTTFLPTGRRSSPRGTTLNTSPPCCACRVS